MKILTKMFLVAFASTLLVACGAKDEKPKGVIPQGHLDAMKKAENVEGVLMDAEKQQREAMDAANL